MTMNSLEKIVEIVSSSFHKTASDRYFIDELQALVLNKELASKRVQEPYYTISEDKLNGEKIILKSFFFIPEENRKIIISRAESSSELFDGVITVTTKRFFLHFRKNNNLELEDLETDLKNVLLTIHKGGNDKQGDYIMHSVHNSFENPYLTISSGKRKINIAITLFLDSGSEPRVQNKNRGFVGLIHYYALSRLIKKLCVPDPQYYLELEIYFDWKYSLKVVSTTGVGVTLLIIFTLLSITVSLITSNIIVSRILGITGIVFISIVPLYYVKTRKNFNVKLINPELLNDQV